MVLTRHPSHIAPAALNTRPILVSRIDFHLKACGVFAACALLGAAGASAATLLSSAEAAPAFQPASAGLFAPAQGRQGPIAQPSGLGAATIVRETTQPQYVAPREDRAGGGETATRTKKRRTGDGAGTTTKRRRPQVEREEEPAPARTVERERPARPEAETEPAREVVDFKDYKGATAMATTAKDILNVEFGWGWYNEYYFRGVNILKSVSSERTTNGVFTTRAVLAYIRPKDAFTVGFNYWQALGRQQPKGGEFRVPPNSEDKSGRKFSLPSRDRYAEYNFNLAYTRTLIEGQLTGTVGFNRYQFSNGTFYETGSSRAITYADESIVKLTYTGQKYITPSISWAHDFDGFKGDFFEFRVDGNFELPAQGSITAAIRPYVSLSYDMDYNGANNGLNSVELGADLPIRLGNHLTLTFTGNYVQALEASEGNRRATTGFWGGVALSANWGGPQREIETTYDKAAKKVILADLEPKKWELSLGAGYHSVDYGFSHGRVSPYGVGRLFDERRRSIDAARGPNNRINDIGFARPGANKIYDDGAVLGAVPAEGGSGGFGVAPAVFQNLFQIQGSIGSNAYLRLSSSVNDYGTASSTFSPISDDQDATVSPYITLDREIARKDSFSLRAGVAYGFLSSTGDSGYGVARLDSLIETRSRFGMDYPLDNVAFRYGFGQSGFRQLVVIDPDTYANTLLAGGKIDASTAAFLRRLRPIFEFEKTQGEVVAVATFVRSSLDLNAHDLALPVSLRKDFGNRLHVEFSVAPTVTLVDAELKTDINRRALTNLQEPKTNVFARTVLPTGNISPNGSLGGVIPIPGGVTPVATSLPPTPVEPSPPQPRTAGGKGATPQSADFPGKSVGNSVHRRDELNFLFGVKGQASIIFDLNDEKTLYAELWGGYHWVQEMHVNNGFAEASIDLSGFQAGIGLGFRF